MSISIDPSQILIKIWDATAGELKHLRRPKPRIEELKKARKRLEDKADDINNQISLNQLEGEIATSEVQGWLCELEELKGKAAATEQDFENRRCLCGWSWNCFSVNRRVTKRMDDIHELMTTNRTAPPVTTKKPPPSVVQIPTSNSTLAIEAYMSKILGYIAGPNASEVIGIYGMGGVGKTTLLSNINNHKDVAKFDHVIWVVASRECKMERLQRDIANRLELNLKQNDNEEGRAAKLCDFLKNKDCLLLLDDLWEALDLAKLGMVHASLGQGEQQKRNVVVFTTRHEQVCGGMKASKKMEIKCLEPEQAWELFRRNIGEDAIGSDAGIERIAHQIAQECAGLPLALITVGMAMSTKKSWEAWNDALTLMKRSQMPKITGKADPMFSAFKLSFDSLEDDDMRGCLLSCALWPEDHLIDKEELIECWMGLGLIDEEDVIYKAYNRGHSHIETLKAACLLEPDDDKERAVKMHDVIRDMALWMASNCGKKKFKWIVTTGVIGGQAFEEERWHEAERVSLMYKDIACLPSQLPTCSMLSVLILQYNYKLQEVCGTLIQAMPSLTYLDLEGSIRITKIPKEIGMLSQLQHLNLSRTQIEELPPELGYLSKLNYLFLRDMYKLERVTKGAISSLSSLKFLDLRGSRFKNEWLDEVEGLKGCHKCSIGIDIKTTVALERLYSIPHVLIWRLSVQYYYDSTNPNQLLDDIIKSHNTRQSMEQLIIEDVELKELLISEASGLECLKYLNLYNLYELEEITWKGVLPQIVFPNLRKLNIYGCDKLRNVKWVLQLPSLSVLKISSCHAMEELISDKDNSICLSFGLRTLRLFQLDKLTKISWSLLNFPNLEEIEVLDCPLLRNLSVDKIDKLKMIRCGQKWWDNLEWEDKSIKNVFSPLVTVTIVKDVLPRTVEQTPTSHSTVGIEEPMGIILGHIASPNAIEVIGIYGMAGVGKTSLLYRINNHVNVDKFDHVIWAVASKECKMERLQRDIANKLGLSLELDYTERDNASKLFNFLENKDCLLLLDDLWEPLDLTKLGITLGTQGQQKHKRKVVVFTTRNEELCSDMNVGTKVEVNCFVPENAIGSTRKYAMRKNARRKYATRERRWKYATRKYDRGYSEYS